MKFISFILLFLSLNAFAYTKQADFTYLTPYQIEATLNQDHESLGLSDEEIDAAFNYALEAYRDINIALRSENPKTLTENRNLICHLDSALRKYQLKGVLLYRGHNNLNAESLKLGSLFTSKAYTSTSIDRMTAVNFAATNAPYVLDIIHVDQYTHGLWLNPISEFPEEEILLPRNLTFRVLKVTNFQYLNKTIIQRHLEIVGESRSPKTDSVLQCP